MVEFDKSASEPPAEGQPQQGGQPQQPPQSGQQPPQGGQQYGQQPPPQQPQGGAPGAAPGYGQPYGAAPGGPQYGYPQQGGPQYGGGQQYGAYVPGGEQPQQPYGAPGGPGWGGQPGYGYAPQRPSTSPAMWAHLGAVLTVFVGTGMCCIGMLCGWIAPLSIRGNGQNEHDPYIRHHTAQGMNYGITQAIMSVITAVLYFVVVVGGAVTADSGTGDPGAMFFIPLIAYLVIFGAYWITTLVFGIIGTVKANSGQLWSYPTLVAWRFVKN
ncbi:DUF4870 domain-containing protein [Streptomyces sp. CA-132043]|uniref:DUF4870 domain-containing protein n=1 Tax=Streptomyces sp. CA-132043 TaxID=3240048 RepID=UPI003D8C373F